MAKGEERAVAGQRESVKQAAPVDTPADPISERGRWCPSVQTFSKPG